MTIDIAYVDTDAWLAEGAAFVADLRGLLDANEIGRAARFATPLLRDRFIVAHAVLRVVLGDRLGVPPRLVALARDTCVRCGAPHGRPVVRGRALSFSLSHCDGVVLVATSATGPIGVDAERVREFDDPMALAAQIAGQDELALLRSSRDTALEFLRLWVRKEAVVKATGEGISASRKYSFATGSPAGWHVSLLDVGSRHVAAVATRSAGERVRLHRVSPPSRPITAHGDTGLRD